MMTKKDRYIAFSFAVSDHEWFTTLEEAKDWIKECAVGDDGFISDDPGYIAEITHESYLHTIEDRKDYTDEQWEEEGYPDDYDEIVEVRFREYPEKVFICPTPAVHCMDCSYLKECNTGDKK